MGCLVFADRDEVCARKQDVCDLAHWVVVETDRSALDRQAVDLGFQSWVSFKHAQRGHERKEHRQFGVFGDIALDHERRLFGIEADGKPVEGYVEYGLTYEVDVVEMIAKGLVVGNEEIALILVLKIEPVLQRPDVVPQMERASGTNAGKDSRLGTGRDIEVSTRLGL